MIYDIKAMYDICLEFSKCTAASKSIDAACICIEAINGTAVEEMLVSESSLFQNWSVFWALSVFLGEGGVCVV